MCRKAVIINIPGGKKTLLLSTFPKMNLIDSLVLPCGMGLSQQFSVWLRGLKEEDGLKISAVGKNNADQLLKMYKNWNSITSLCECLPKDLHCRVMCST